MQKMSVGARVRSEKNALCCRRAQASNVNACRVKPTRKLQWRWWKFKLLQHLLAKPPFHIWLLLFVISVSLNVISSNFIYVGQLNDTAPPPHPTPSPDKELPVSYFSPSCKMVCPAIPGLLTRPRSSEWACVTGEEWLTMLSTGEV